MSTNKSNTLIAKNTILLSLRNVLSLAIYLYSTRVILQALGIEDYGIYNVVCGFVAMFIFLNTSMSNGIQRFYNYELGKNGYEGARLVFQTSILIQLGLLVSVLVLTEVIGMWYMNTKMVIPAEKILSAKYLFHTSVASFAFIILQVPFTAAIMAHEKMNFYSAMSLLDAILKLASAAVLPVFSSDRLVIYGLFIAGISLLNLLTFSIYASRSFTEIKFAPYFNATLFKSMLTFSGWNIFGSLAGVMKEQGLNMILNIFFGPVVNAARGIAYQVSAGFQSLIGNIHTAIRPQLIQSYAVGNQDRVEHLMEFLSKTSSMFLYAISYPIWLEIDFVLRIWLGNNVPDNTAAFIRIILFINIIYNLNSAVSMIIHATGKMRNYQLITSLISLFTLPAAYWAFKMGAEPIWGLILCLFFSAISQVASILIMSKLTQYSPANYLKRILLPFTSVILVSFWIPCIPIFFLCEGWTRFCVVTITGFIGILGIIYLLGLSRTEQQMFKKFIRQKMHLHD